VTTTMPSYVSGVSDTPLLFLTIGQALDQAASRYGERDAVVMRHQNLRMTYAELKAAVDELAAGLLSLGLQPGERIGIWAPNRIEWILTQFATAKLGLILVNINPAYRISELEYALNHVACKALVTADSFKSSDYVALLREIAPELDHSEPGALVSARLPHLRSVICTADHTIPGMFRFADIVGAATPALRARAMDIEATLDPDDCINIQFTSGTTGMPKGATLTHFNVVNNGYFVGLAMKFSERDRLCIPVPLYHCFGMVMGVLTCTTHGAAMVFPGEGFDPAQVLEAVAAERCTALHGVPTMFIGELDHDTFASADLSSLRTGIMAGAPCPVEVMKRVQKDMNMSEVTIAYGMTETSPVSFQSSTDDPIDKRVATVGRVMPHVQVKIVNEDGKTVTRGARGELCTRGYSVMRSYWDEPEKTAASIDAGGWMHTGDLAIIDDQGYCNIVGRVKDMIIRGGENVYPREIEEYLYRHPKIQDVAVFGVPDERFGEAIATWIRLREDESATPEEILDFCRGQIAHYKVPAHIRFVEEFPMTVTGKIQKFMMRDAMVEELGLKAAKTA
jgi:fatty-acyl-CoA synthase